MLAGFMKYLPLAWMDCNVLRFTVSCSQCAAMLIILRNSTHFTCFDHRLFFIFPHLCLIMLKGRIKIPPYRPCPARENIGQYRIILSADTASEVRQLLSQKRR